jgi:hypothetical protein
MTRKKQNHTNVEGDVWAKESADLAKSIANDLNLPDKPVSMEEWAKINPFTGEARKFGEHDVFFNFAPSDGTAEETRERQIEHDRITKLDRDDV